MNRHPLLAGVALLLAVDVVLAVAISYALIRFFFGTDVGQTLFCYFIGG